MKIFNKNEPHKEEMQSTTDEMNGSNYSSYISYGCRYVGNVEGDSNVRIDGELIGDITIKGNLKIGEKGKVLGKIIATSVEIFGILEGDTQCDEILVIRKSSNVKGNIVSNYLVIENGAAIEGNIKVKALANQ